ncbi:hypothetical protein [Flavobacterium chungangense]|uniref:hypothetical protein n=2 Tax=Flavobacterium chungangense TaxID=554283 RepID=UPI0004DF0F4D|nr:hypothetical protein [Flavobacterium chungangense]
MSFFKKLFGKVSETEKVKAENIASQELTQKSYVEENETDKESIENYPAEELKQKFFRNLELMVEYDILIDNYCDIFETWEDKPIGSKLSYNEIHPKIKHILEVEFSEDICERVKNGEINSDEIESFISKLDADYLLYKPQCDYTQKTEDNLLDKFKNGEL